MEDFEQSSIGVNEDDLAFEAEQEQAAEEAAEEGIYLVNVI